MTGPSVWAYDDENTVWHIHGRDCWIWMDARPAHCDRGRWLARVELKASAFPKLEVDHADCWPRYYFDFDRAKLEIEAWLRVRQQWMDA